MITPEALADAGFETRGELADYAGMLGDAGFSLGADVLRLLAEAMPAPRPPEPDASLLFTVIRASFKPGGETGIWRRSLAGNYHRFPDKIIRDYDDLHDIEIVFEGVEP